MSHPGRWELRTSAVPGELVVDGEMAGGASPMPFPVPVREDRVTDEDLALAETVIDACFDAGDGTSDSQAQARAVCAALLKGGRRPGAAGGS